MDTAPSINYTLPSSFFYVTKGILDYGWRWLVKINQRIQFAIWILQLSMKIHQILQLHSLFVCRCELQASSKSMIASLTVANFSFHRKDYKNMYVRFLERRPYDDGSEIIGINHLVIFHSMRWSLIIMFIKSAHSCSECLLQSDLKSWIDCKTHQCFRKSKHHLAFFWIFSIIIIGSDGFRSWISRSKKEV